MDSLILEILKTLAKEEKALSFRSNELSFISKEKRALFLDFLESECGFIKKYSTTKQENENKYWLTIKGYNYLKSNKKKIGF